MSDPSNPFGALHSLRSASLSTSMKSPTLTSSSSTSSTSSSETHNPFGGAPALNNRTNPSSSASAIPLSSAAASPIASSPMPPPKTLSDHVHDFLSGPQLACVCECAQSSSPPVPPLRLISLSSSGGGGGGGGGHDKSSSAVRPLPALLATVTGQDGKQCLPRVTDVVRALRDHQYLRIIEAVPIAEECFSALSQTAAAQNASSLGRGIALVQMRTLALIALKKASFAVADSSSALKVLLSFLKSNHTINSSSSSSDIASVNAAGVEALCVLLCIHGTALTLSGLWREAVTILHAVLRLASGVKYAVIESDNSSSSSNSKSVFSSWAAKAQSFTSSESCPISEQVLAFLYSRSCVAIFSSLSIVKRARLVTLSSVRCSDALHGAGYAMAAINALQEGVKALSVKNGEAEDLTSIWLQRGVLGCLLSNSLKTAGKDVDAEKAMSEAMAALDAPNSQSTSVSGSTEEEEMRLFASAYTSILRAQALLVQTQQQQQQGQQQQQQLQQQHFQALGLSETGLIAASKALKLQQSRIDILTISSSSLSSTVPTPIEAAAAATTATKDQDVVKDKGDEAISSTFGGILTNFFSPGGSGLPDSADVFVDACLVTAEALKRSSWASFSSAGGGAMMARPADVLLAAVRTFPSVCLEKSSFIVALITNLEGSGVSATNALGGGGGGGMVVVGGGGGGVPRGGPSGPDAMSVAILKRVLFSVGQRSGLGVDESKFRLGGGGGGGLRSFAIASALAATASAQSLYSVQDEFVHIGYSNEDAMVRFSAAMPIKNQATLEAKLLDISNPTSPNFGQWMTRDEVNALIEPSAGDRADVRKWVTSTGAKCVDMPSSLKCVASVSSVNKLLKTKLSAFQQKTQNNKVVHRLHPESTYTSWPNSLDDKLLFLTNLADFPTVKRRNGAIKQIEMVDGKVQATDYAVVLETLIDFYQLKGVKGAKVSSTAPAEFQGDSCYNKKDLSEMAKSVGVPDWNITKTVGPCTGQNPDLEASLDEQYMGATGYGNDQHYWTDPDWMYDWTQTLMKTADADLPGVFSISWGWSEADQCQIDKLGPCKTNAKNSSGFVEVTNAQFAAVTARGVTFMVSSGDSGAHGRTDPSCAKPKTLPDWPTACPWITAVGASQIQNGVHTAPFTSPYCTKAPAGLPECATGGTEITCSTATGALITSGGGFSNVAPTPSWQAAAVAGYLKDTTKLPAAADFNATGRAYPDVSALGHNYIIWAQGQPTQVDGTSCSAPVWGAVVGLINAARLTAGKKAVGFLNPALYQVAAANPNVFHDITVGDNKCTEGGCNGGKCTGFGAAVGYDAATGFGTPNVAALVAAFVALP